MGGSMSVCVIAVLRRYLAALDALCATVKSGCWMPATRSSSGLRSAKRHTVRAFAILLVLGCAVASGGQVRAAVFHGFGATGAATKLLDDKSGDCWSVVFYDLFDQRWYTGEEMGDPDLITAPGPEWLNRINHAKTDSSYAYVVEKNKGGRREDQQIMWEFPAYKMLLTRVKCPETEDVAYAGPSASIQFSQSWATMGYTESLAGVIADENTVRSDPFGIGFSFGYGFRPWANRFIVEPFVSFDYLGWSVNQTFPGGSFLGTRNNFDMTWGVKGGPAINPHAWVYAIVGVSALNETLNVNFIPLASSSTQTVPGATVGVGGAIMPSFLQGFGRPVSLSLEYQHTWWRAAQFNTPAASPLFNYNFHREDDVIKFGFTVYFGSPPTAAPPQSSMPLKAPPSR